jgi:peptide/nickel transport system substrate-binding protein
VIGLGCGRPLAHDPDALVVMLPRDAEQLDPRFVGDPYGLRVSRLLFGSLVTIDPRTLEVIPDLAESVTASSPTRFEVRLRDGLRFSDGSPLDAQDVVATFQGVIDPKLRSRYAHTYRRIAEMRVSDPRTILFILHEPHATFLTDLELPIVRSEDAFRRIATPDDPFPVGAGPYLLVKREPGILELSANPHWHRGTPKYPSLRLVVIRDDNTRALRMLAGQGDLAIASIPPLLLPMFREDPRFETRSAAGISTMYLGFQTMSPKLDDVRVRRAIGYAIDRELIVRAKYDGLARVTDSWIPYGHWADVDALPPRGFDPDQARALLDVAGFPDPPGSEPRMRLVLRTTSERFRQSVARAIAAMLGDVRSRRPTFGSGDADLRPKSGPLRDHAASSTGGDRAARPELVFRLVANPGSAERGCESMAVPKRRARSALRSRKNPSRSAPACGGLRASSKHPGPRHSSSAFVAAGHHRRSPARIELRRTERRTLRDAGVLNTRWYR